MKTMNHVRAATHTLCKPADSRFAVLLACRRGSASQRRKRVAAWVLMLALVVGAGNSHAATFIWTNTAASGVWQDASAWTTNGGGTGGFPGSGDSAFFTNAATYSVTLTSDVLNIQSNFFSNASNTTATVTLNLGAYELNPIYAGTSPGAFVVGEATNCTTIVYLASSTVAGKGLVVPARIVVGRNGIGTLFVTNGNVSVATTILANAANGRGTVVLSGPNTFWSNSSAFAIGNNSNSFGSSLVISNSASMTVASTFRLGSGASSGGSSNNTLLLDTGGRLFTHSGPVTIGRNSSGAPPSYNNTATVQGGAVWDNGNSTFVIGTADTGAATGNVLTVGAGGAVINISQLTITANNTLNLAGGLIDATTTSDGTLQGFGTAVGNVTINGFLSPANALGQLTFSNKLILASTSTTTVQLGTNFSTSVVIGNLTLGGTLNVTDGGGFTNGTYTLFTYRGTLTDNGLTIGTTPNTNFTYAVDTSTAHVVNLVVTGPVAPPVADFTGSRTSGAAPLAVTFTDSSTGSITNRHWSFGDGTTTDTIVTNLTHTYTDAASYDVSLTVSGPGGTDTLSRLGYITVTNAPPVADFTGSPTSGPAPLAATFTNSSTGTITDCLWDFGDGTTSNTTVTSLTHNYTSAANYDVSLTVSGPAGTNTLDRSGYITVAPAPPAITGGLTVTNAVLQVGGVAVVVVGDTNVFSVGAAGSNPLSYQWSFGDGVTNAWSSSGTAEHAYTTTNCGPYDASVIISNEQATLTSNFTIVVACQLNIAKLQTKLNFAKTNADSGTVSGTFDLPADYSFAGKLATLDIGGAEVSFTLDSKGGGVTGFNKFSKPKYKKKTGLWTFSATLKNGSWQTPWADYSMINSNISKPGVLVNDLPVILLLDTEAFMETKDLHYTAKHGKSGAAK